MNIQRHLLSVKASASLTTALTTSLSLARGRQTLLTVSPRQAVTSDGTVVNWFAQSTV